MSQINRTFSFNNQNNNKDVDQIRIEKLKREGFSGRENNLNQSDLIKSSEFNYLFSLIRDDISNVINQLNTNTTNISNLENWKTNTATTNLNSHNQRINSIETWKNNLYNSGSELYTRIRSNLNSDLTSIRNNIQTNTNNISTLNNWKPSVDNVVSSYNANKSNILQIGTMKSDIHLLKQTPSRVEGAGRSLNDGIFISGIQSQISNVSRRPVGQIYGDNDFNLTFRKYNRNNTNTTDVFRINNDNQLTSGIIKNYVDTNISNLRTIVNNSTLYNVNENEYQVIYTNNNLEFTTNSSNSISITLNNPKTILPSLLYVYIETPIEYKYNGNTTWGSSQNIRRRKLIFDGHLIKSSTNGNNVISNSSSLSNNGRENYTERLKYVYSEGYGGGYGGSHSYQLELNITVSCYGGNIYMYCEKYILADVSEGSNTTISTSGNLFSTFSVKVPVKVNVIARWDGKKS